MTYLRDKQRQKNTLIATTLFILAFILCFVYRVQVFGTLSPVGAFFSSTFSFLQTPYDAVKRFAFAGISSKATLVAQNEELSRNVEETEALRERVLLLEGDIARLEKMNATSTVHSEGIIARRIHAPGATLYNTFIIDRGMADGVERGDLLLGEGGTLLGTVEEVFSTTARGVIFSAPNISTEARIATSSLPMTLQGVGSGTFFARVPQGVQVDIGSIVVNQEYPRWSLGEVIDIERKPQDPFQTVFVKSSESPYMTVFVRVAHHE